MEHIGHIKLIKAIKQIIVKIKAPDLEEVKLKKMNKIYRL